MIHDRDLQPRFRLRSLLGMAPVDTPQIAPDRHGAPMKSERARILDAIAAFILDNNLELTPGNLLAAFTAFSGGNPRLRRQIGERAEAGERVTQAWLDRQIEEDGEAEAARGYERMTLRLQTSVAKFGDTASSARDAVAGYGRDLADRAEEMAQQQPAASIASLRESSRGMIELTRAFEERLMRAEREAQGLRDELAKAQRDATLDPLTKLPNRRGFEALFEAEFHKARGAVEPMCVAFCDIDRFKRINDSFGHDTGDRVIAAVAELLRQSGTAACHAARHGGEEFVMIFRGLTTDQARESIEHMRMDLAKRRFVQESSGEVIGKVSFSAGIADVFASPDRRLALRAADEALYRAKQAGRDRVEIAGR